ncbi:hypothetical protein Nmel_013981 [Mimus melanotis]
MVAFGKGRDPILALYFSFALVLRPDTQSCLAEKPTWKFLAPRALKEAPLCNRALYQEYNPCDDYLDTILTEPVLQEEAMLTFAKCPHSFALTLKMGPGMKAVGLNSLEPQTGEFRFYLQHAREFCLPVMTCARSNTPLPWKRGLSTAVTSCCCNTHLATTSAGALSLHARALWGAVIQLGSEDLRLLPVPSCVYLRKHFCLLGSESPRSGSPSPACCSRKSNGRRGGVWAAFLLHLGLGLLCNAVHRFAEGKNQGGWSPWLLLYSPARHSVAVPLEQRAAKPALCWLHGLQLVPSPVACSLLVLRAGWDSATAEGIRLCLALSRCWADLCQFPQELQAGDFSGGEAGTGPSCLPSCRLPQAVGGILCGWSKLSCSFCHAVSFAVVCMCCPLAQSS